MSAQWRSPCLYTPATIRQHQKKLSIEAPTLILFINKIHKASLRPFYLNFGLFTAVIAIIMEALWLKANIVAQIQLSCW